MDSNYDDAKESSLLRLLHAADSHFPSRLMKFFSVRNRATSSDADSTNSSPQLFDLGFGESSSVGEGGNGFDSEGLNIPPSPPTTCFSPVLSAKNSSSGSSSSLGGLSSKDRQNDTAAFDVSNLFAPYSTALSVTIGIGKRHSHRSMLSGKVNNLDLNLLKLFKQFLLCFHCDAEWRDFLQ